MWLSTVFTFCCFILLTNSEMYSSMHKLQNALSIFKDQNNNFRRKLEYYLQNGRLTTASEEHRNEVDRILKRLSKFESFENPIAAFDFMFHMTKIKNWLVAEDLWKYFADEVDFIPAASDVRGAADGLLLLQWLYELSAPQMITGKNIKKINEALPTPLTSNQIDFMAIHASTNDFHKIAAKWIVQAIKNKDGDRRVFFQREYVKRTYEKWMPLSKKIPLLLRKSVVNSKDLRIWESFLSLCLNFEEFELAIGAAQTIQLLHGYHYSGVLANKKKWIPDVHKKCFKMTSLEEKVEAMDYQLDYLSEMVNGDLDYCLDDVEEFKEGEPIIRSGMCRWSVPSPFYTIGPLKEEILSEDPEIKLWHDFIHDSEIKNLLEHSGNFLQRKRMDGGENLLVEGYIRKAQIDTSNWPNELYPRLDARLQSATNLQVDEDTSEYYQCTNYGIGGVYHFHYDATSYIHNRESVDRLMTVMVYLTDVKLGGATVFPKANVAVKPRKGMAILWYNMKRNSAVREDVLHAGCPVFSGNKWVMNKWIRYVGQSEKRPCTLRKNAS